MSRMDTTSTPLLDDFRRTLDNSDDEDEEPTEIPTALPPSPQSIIDHESRLEQLEKLTLSIGSAMANLSARFDSLADRLTAVSYTHLTLPTNREV